VSDRDDDHSLPALLAVANTQHNRTRSVLVTVLAAGKILAPPEVAVAKHEARIRRGN
jgi:hypothetical protein